MNHPPLRRWSYPEPGGLVGVQLQSGVSDGGELGDDRGAVPQHETKAHGPQHRCKRGQVQLLVLHFTKKREQSRLETQRVWLSLYLCTCICCVQVKGETMVDFYIWGPLFVHQGSIFLTR